MKKACFQLRPSKASLLPVIWLVVAMYLYFYFSFRLQLPKYVNYIVISLITIFYGITVIKYFGVFIDILPDGLCCIYPINRKMKMTWDEIKSAGLISKKIPFGTETWLYISAEEAPSLDNSFYGKSDGKTIFAIDRPELRKALKEHGIRIQGE